MNINTLPIPKQVKYFSVIILIFTLVSQVLDYDRKQSKMSSAVSNSSLNMSSWHPDQQFGVTLEWILDNQHCTIPPVMNHCIDFLQQPECLETEGIFRYNRLYVMMMSTRVM